jgi:hypothetical protein
LPESQDFSIGGQVASLLVGRRLNCGIGDYVLVGNIADLIKISIYILEANSGSFDVSGIAANLFRVINLSASIGDFAIDGQSVSFFKDRVLRAEGGYLRGIPPVVLISDGKLAKKLPGGLILKI